MRLVGLGFNIKSNTASASEIDIKLNTASASEIDIKSNTASASEIDINFGWLEQQVSWKGRDYGKATESFGRRFSTPN